MGRKDGNKHHRPRGYDGGSGGKWVERIETSASLIVTDAPDSVAPPGAAEGARAGRPVRFAPLAGVSGAPVTRGGLTTGVSGAHERADARGLRENPVARPGQSGVVRSPSSGHLPRPSVAPRTGGATNGEGELT